MDGIKFENNQAIEVKLLNTKPERVKEDTDYGPKTYYYYEVEVDGKQDEMRATQFLHGLIRDQNLNDGAVVEITKVFKNNRTSWEVESLENGVGRGGSSGSRRQRGGSTRGSSGGRTAGRGSQPSSGRQGGSRPPGKSYQEAFDLYWRLIQENNERGKQVFGDDWSVTNSQTAAATFLIAINRGEVTAPSSDAVAQGTSASGTNTGGVSPKQFVAGLLRKVGVSRTDADAFLEFASAGMITDINDIDDDARDWLSELTDGGQNLAELEKSYTNWQASLEEDDSSDWNDEEE